MESIAMDDATRTGAAEAPDAKEALRRFVTDFKTFQERIETKMKIQEDRLGMLDRRAGARPALAGESRAPERKALAAYLRDGDETGLRAAALERKALVGTAGTEGGYLVDTQTAGDIAALRKGASSLRAIANVVSVEGGAYEVLVDHAGLETAWVSEAAAMGETGTSPIERITIPLHELAAMPKVSQRLLDDSAFDIEGWLAASIAETFGRAEAAAFILGDGVEKPTGLLRYDAVADADWAWGALGYVATGVEGGFSVSDPSNDVVDLVYSLGARYRANGAFLMNSKTAGTLRKMKDADGRFLWHESLSCGEPSRLLGYPVITCEAMPDIGPGATAIAFGDFRAGYTIAERPDLRILRDPFSAKPHVQFYASARVGGAVTDFAAIKLLRFAAA
ncbi:MAG: phage major capsid protein [Rhodobacteraceae bacterium]|nr:MAG: phage major capsid protein [Paracoccaceae bacterium]